MRSDHHRPSRLAIAFVVVGLALSAIGIAYIIYAGRERGLPPISAPQPDPRVQQLEALVRMLTLSFLLFLVFLVGSYLMVRIGRRLLHHAPFRGPSEYVDVWGNYRLTQDQIDAATREPEEQLPPDAPPRDTEPQPPDQEP
jgi:hypothetical protein